MYENLAILAGFIFLYSIAGTQLAKTPINGALVFIAFGVALGPLGLGILNLSASREQLRLVTELALGLVLFTDAANANIGVLKRTFRIPGRLLLIGLPLTILLGVGVGVLLFDSLGLFEIVLLAIILAPTDAALGKAVVTNESVPADIREGLNTESGLNDGVCVPILLLFLILATSPSITEGTFLLTMKLVAAQIGLGIAVGLGLTALCAWVVKQFSERGWVNETWLQLPIPALAVACFALAQSLGGSGFIAAFTGGLLFGKLASQHKHPLLLAAEGTGDTLALITWVVFGNFVVTRVVDYVTWQAVLYAVLSLTVVRMLPVYLALAGSGLRPGQKLFIGWFGPRGLASIVFTVIVLDAQTPGGYTLTITVVCTIVLSIVLHGLSAVPLVAALRALRGQTDP